MTVKVILVGDIVAEILKPVEGHSLEECFPADLIESSHEAPDQVQPGWVFNGSGFSPPSEPDPQSFVPKQITRAQAKIQLRRANLRDQVEALIAKADPEVQDWYAEAGTWLRDNTNVAAMAKQLKLKDADVDELFRQAALIEA